MACGLVPGYEGGVGGTGGDDVSGEECGEGGGEEGGVGGAVDEGEALEGDVGGAWGAEGG